MLMDDNVKQEPLAPLEEDAAHFKARMEFREMLRAIEKQLAEASSALQEDEGEERNAWRSRCDHRV